MKSLSCLGKSTVRMIIEGKFQWDIVGHSWRCRIPLLPSMVVLPMMDMGMETEECNNINLKRSSNST